MTFVQFVILHSRNDRIPSVCMLFARHPYLYRCDFLRNKSIHQTLYYYNISLKLLGYIAIAVLLISCHVSTELYNILWCMTVGTSNVYYYFFFKDTSFCASFHLVTTDSFNNNVTCLLLSINTRCCWFFFFYVPT